MRNPWFITTLVVVFAALGGAWRAGAQPSAQGSGAASTPIPAATLDKLLAPIALYPDPLILQIVQCAASPYQVKQVNQWLIANPDLKGTAVQDAASNEGFDASFVAIVLFPQVLQMMADDPDWTRQLGEAFHNDRDGVFDSIQRLRTQAEQAGNLQSNAQQTVETVTTQGGDQVIVIQPANPQIVYVPQYDPQVVYVESDSSSGGSGNVAAAAVIGFAAGVIIGAAADDDDDHYYYACGGWGYHGAALCNEGWEDYYDHREDMANDFYDHREKMAEQRGENQSNRQDARNQNQSDRQDSRTQNQSSRQDSRTQNQSTRQDQRSQSQSTRADNRSTRQSTASETRAANQSSRQSGAARTQAPSQTSRAGASSRGSFQNKQQAAPGSAGTKSDAFSGYQRGSTERASSQRGRSSMSGRSGGRSGGGSRGGGRRG